MTRDLKALMGTSNAQADEHLRAENYKKHLYKQVYASGASTLSAFCAIKQLNKSKGN